MSLSFHKGFKQWFSLSIVFAVSFIWVSVAQAVEWWPVPRDFSLKQGQSKTVPYTMDRYGDTSPVNFQASGGSGITVSFSPNPNTTNKGTLTFTASANATVTTQHVIVKAITPKQTNAQDFEIYVQKGPTAAVSVSPSSLSFSAQAGASVAAKTVTVTNSGSASLTINSLSLAGTNAALYNLNATSCNGKTLAAGTNCSVSVGFNGSATVGTYAAQVNISSSASTNPSIALSATVTAAADFSVSASPSSVNLAQGGTASATLNLARTNNTRAISFSVSGLPSGVSANISNNNTTGNSSSISFTATSAAATGSATVNVQASDGTLSRSTTLSLNVLASSYALSVAPPALNIIQGQNASSVVSIARTNFTSAVSLSVTAPAGVTGTFSPASTTGNSSTLTLNVANNTAPGAYIVGITGQGGSSSQTTALSLVVEAAPADFTVSASPSSVSINQGAAGAVTLNLSRNNYTEAVNFTVSGLPAGVTSSFTANNTTGDSSVLNLAVDASAAVGSSTITVQAAGSTINHTASFTLNVTAQPNYTLGAPAPISIGQGSAGSVSIAITRTNFTNAINFSAVAPAGVSATFSPASATGNTTTLNLTVAASANPGPYAVQIQGTSGSITQNTALSLTVTATPPNFTMTVSPSSVNVKQGASGSFTVNFSRTNLTDTITPTIAGLPANVSGSCTDATNTTSTCTLTAASAASIGVSTLTIQASAASITRSATVSLSISAPTVALPAFPGAIGFGAFAKGGRGGDVYHVTNLNASGAGSLQYGIDTATGPRTIVFDVSGVIRHLIEMNGKSYITIAGQTNPVIIQGIITDEQSGQGFCDQDESCIVNSVKSHDLIFQNLWLRKPPEDTLRLRAAQNVICDHCSLENTVDESLETSYSNRLTVQNSILAEGEGGHEWNGWLINYTTAPFFTNPTAQPQPVDFSINSPLNDTVNTAFTFANNLMSRLRGRFPENSNESPNAHKYIKEIEVVNNLMWDPQYYMESAHMNPFTNQPLANYYNYVGNYWITRASYPYGMFDLHGGSPNDKVYIFDNHIEMYPGLEDWEMQYCCNDFKVSGQNGTAPSWAISRPNTFKAPRIDFTPIDSRTQVTEHIYKNAGAFPRNPMDRRLMSSICSGVIDTTAVNVNPAGDAFAMDPAPPTPADTDRDGMPDAWETAHGLNPNAADNNGTNLSAEGYTNLEIYLQDRMAQLVAQEPSIRQDCQY